jgi:V-type H+-transporting ATPase subunit E
MADDSNLSLEDFLLLEAKERCYEIEVKGLKDFEKEKTRILDQGKEDVKEALEKKLRTIEAQKKIERSSRINSSRLRKMNSRNEVVMRILGDAEVELARRIETDRGFYKELLRKLIIQSFISLLEHKITIKCLERDRQLIEEIIPGCVKEFQDLAKREMDVEEWPLEAVIDNRGYLQLRNLKDVEEGHERGVHKADEDKKCFGGIIVFNGDLSIICKNTVDARLELCFQDSLPPIRGLLFPDK